MSVTMGKVSEFNPDEDDWNTYIEQLELFFEANRISDELQRKAILLSSCGITTYKLFKGLTAPVKPDEKSFDELKQLMLHHQNPCPNDSQTFQTQLTCKKCRQKCFNVSCRIDEVGRILQIKRIVKQYVEGQISRWY